MTDPMAALRLQFIDRCRADLQEIRRLGERAETAEIGAIVHRLAGTAGSFGFPAISLAALEVDQKIRDSRVVSGTDMETLLALLGELSN